jgi:large subunit ribosomal protein L23
MKDVYRIVRRSLVTEKTNLMRAENKYVFEVAREAGKPEIKAAIQELFSVKVQSVRTMGVKGKIKRMGRFAGKRADWKKAIVTLAEGESIDLLNQS